MSSGILLWDETLPQVVVIWSDILPTENIILTFSVMSQTYQAERVLKEQERLQRLGVTGIPFGHRTSIQGNPMRSATYKSSSKYHKNCNKEE